ncbi:hypothetical protein BJY52DRAFT_1190683 [Lactarius psammicola]|nr:hypothetical protein BJY52DRAFT_1190683 [Lactarius psammicola]
MEQNPQPPPSPQHVPWLQDPVPSSPTLDPNDPTHLLAHITTFRKDPLPSLPYNQIMDAGFDPNTQVISQSTSLGQQEGRANYKWLLSSQDLPSGSAEQQGSAPNQHHHLPPIETLAPLPASSFVSLQLTVQYTQPSVQEVTATGTTVRSGLSETTKHFIWEAAANLTAICTARTPDCLPALMRQIIRDMVEERDDPVPPSAASSEIHKDNDFPATVEGFNLSVGLVINALDCGVEDHRGDLEQAGLIPLSWFRLASAILGTIAWGALRSGGWKIQGRVKISDDDPDDWSLAEGLICPVTQGGQIAAQAQQIA